MSLTSTFVKCNDGNYYRDPTWRGNDFFICFDDDDPPEIVIKKPKNLSLQTAYEMALHRLKLAGFNALIRRESYKGGASRCFELGRFKFTKAFSYFIDVLKAPNKPTLPSTPIKALKYEGVVYNFGEDYAELAEQYKRTQDHVQNKH